MRIRVRRRQPAARRDACLRHLGGDPTRRNERHPRHEEEGEEEEVARIVEPLPQPVRSLCGQRQDENTARPRRLRIVRSYTFPRRRRDTFSPCTNSFWPRDRPLPTPRGKAPRTTRAFVRCACAVRATACVSATGRRRCARRDRSRQLAGRTEDARRDASSRRFAELLSEPA